MNQAIIDRPKYKITHSFAYKGKKYNPGDLTWFPEELANRLFKKDWILPSMESVFTDVCAADWNVPDRVYIVGSGPNGIPHYDRIPKDAFIIIVNKMILSPVAENAAIWMVTDPNHPKYDWFRAEMIKLQESNRSITLQDIKVGGPPVPIVDYQRIITHFPFLKCMYKTGIPLFEGTFNLPAHLLRSGATVAGQAVQLVARKGAKEIILCGLDMFGDNYFDGSKHKEPKRANRSWGALPNFNKLVRYLQYRQGIKFFSLSETKIAIERI